MLVRVALHLYKFNAYVSLHKPALSDWCGTSFTKLVFAKAALHTLAKWFGFSHYFCNMFCPRLGIPFYCAEISLSLDKIVHCRIWKRYRCSAVAPHGGVFVDCQFSMVHPGDQQSDYSSRDFAFLDAGGDVDHSKLR